MATRRRSKATDIEQRMARAITAVAECVSELIAQASRLSESTAVAASVPESTRDEVLALAVRLDVEATGAVAVLQELRAAAETASFNAADVVRVLTEIDARLMAVLAGFGDVSARLEKAAEIDERVEPVYVGVVETAAGLLTRFERAQEATRNLRDGMPRRWGEPPPVRRAVDGSTVVLEVAAEGGSLTLVGRPVEGGAWRFARVTDDQSEALFGEKEVGVSAPDLANIDWVDGWEAGLNLMDRYPWPRLHPVYVHPEFVERVKAAVEQRLGGDSSDTSHARYKWERLFEVANVE